MHRTAPGAYCQLNYIPVELYPSISS